ncbi:MAG: hypothetical protein U0235_20020 [Polyangiaceae bacterium]
MLGTAADVTASFLPSGSRCSTSGAAPCSRRTPVATALDATARAPAPRRGVVVAGAIAIVASVVLVGVALRRVPADEGRAAGLGRAPGTASVGRCRDRPIDVDRDVVCIRARSARRWLRLRPSSAAPASAPSVEPARRASGDAKHPAIRPFTAGSASAAKPRPNPY